MKLKRDLLFSVISIFALYCVLFLGCASKERYAYSRIKAEFEKPLPLPSTPLQKPAIKGLDEQSGPISIIKAIRITLKNNPDMDTAIARIRQSEAMIEEAIAAFLPEFSFYSEYMQGDAPSAYLFKTIDQRQLPAGVNFNHPGWFENYEIGIQGKINLFSGGRDLLRKKMAETGLDIYDLDRISVQNALVASVIHAFYNAMAAREYIQIAHESVSTVKTQLRIMEVRYREGGALKSDVLSLKVRLAQAGEDLIKAENNYSLAIASLSNLLGADPDTPVALQEGEELPLDLPDKYNSGLVHALANRPELEKVRRQIIHSCLAMDMARAEYLPRIDAQARYYLDDPGLSFETGRYNWTAGIILNWGLFTGFSTKARVEKSRAVLEEMLAADRKTTQSIQLDLKTAYLRLAEAKARCKVAKASIAQAEESLSLVRKQYEGGSATITRYLDAELAYNRARIRSTTALYDTQKARAAVGRALGYWGTYAEGALKQNE